jgi:hypothetical protein
MSCIICGNEIEKGNDSDMCVDCFIQSLCDQLATKDKQIADLFDYIKRAQPVLADPASRHRIQGRGGA